MFRLLAVFCWPGAGRRRLGALLAAGTLASSAAAQSSHACLQKGGTLVGNLFHDNGTFGSITGGVLDPPTRSPVSGRRTGHTFNPRAFAATGNYSPEDREYEISIRRSTAGTVRGTRFPIIPARPAGHRRAIRTAR